MRGLYRHESALAAVMEHMETTRRQAEPFSDAVRRVQEDFELRRQMRDAVRQIEEKQEALRQIEQRHAMLRQFEQAAAGFESAAFQQLLAELRQRQALLHEMSRSATLGAQALMEDHDTINDVLYRNRALIDPLTWSTYSGGSSGPARASPLVKSHQKLVASYGDLSETETSDKGKALPESVKVLPTTEVFTSAEVIEEISVSTTQEASPEGKKEREERREIRHEISSETLIRLEPALAKVDPGFPRMWRGAVGALRGENPDRVRHFSTSCRELLTQLVHQFAPDGEILQWTSDPEHFGPNQRPTRKARLLYICRFYRGSSRLASFTENDILDVLELLNYYQRGVHSVDAGFSEDEIDALEIRSAHLLFSLASLGKLVN
jgi:Predicted pPIWI-associating nuclease